MLVRHGFMGMTVIVDVLSVHMDVGVGMAVLMGVLQLDSVLDHEIGAEYHDKQGGKELRRRAFTQRAAYRSRRPDIKMPPS